MAGEIQLNSTSFASESGGTITINNATVGSAVAMSANQACVKTALNASGSAPIYACRAWINFDGDSASIGTGRASGNVSGVTDNGTGDYTVTFATAMPDANYACVVTHEKENGAAQSTVIARSTNLAGSVKILTKAYSTGSVNPENVSVAIFR